MKGLNKLGRILDVITDIMALIGAIIIVFIMLAISIGVGTRYLFNIAPGWLIELSGYLMVYLTFFVAVRVLRANGHVTMDIVLNGLNPRARFIANFVTSVLGAVICLVITWYGIYTVLDHVRRGVYVPTDTRILLAPLLAPIPIGAFALCLQFIRRAYAYLKKSRTPMAEQDDREYISSRQ